MAEGMQSIENNFSARFIDRNVLSPKHHVCNLPT